MTFSIITNPALQLAAAGGFTVGLALAAVAIKNNPTAAKAAKIGADLVAALDPYAKDLAATGVPLLAGLAQLEGQAKAWLDQQGIQGSQRDLVEQDLPALIGLAVGKATK